MSAAGLFHTSPEKDGKEVFFCPHIFFFFPFGGWLSFLFFSSFFFIHYNLLYSCWGPLSETSVGSVDGALAGSENRTADGVLLFKTMQFTIE